MSQFTIDYAVVAVYENTERAQRVVRALYSARVPLDQLSLVGRHDSQQPRIVAKPVRFGAWGMLSSSAVMYVSGLGLIRTAGFFVSLVNAAHAQLGPDISPIWTALRRLGLAKKLAADLDASVSAGYCLVIVRGGRSETARVARFLPLLQGGAVIEYRVKLNLSLERPLVTTDTNQSISQTSLSTSFAG